MKINPNRLITSDHPRFHRPRSTYNLSNALLYKHVLDHFFTNKSEIFIPCDPIYKINTFHQVVGDALRYLCREDLPVRGAPSKEQYQEIRKKLMLSARIDGLVVLLKKSHGALPPKLATINSGNNQFVWKRSLSEFIQNEKSNRITLDKLCLSDLEQTWAKSILEQAGLEKFSVSTNEITVDR